ncbi:site-specific DNA-methyltransferase [Paenibacillus amylolyticus]|uniref:site-specific DNA-methyltransferase n=1 Tax=Paenibacillus amylolyticus TaxID=1451 RepID=UPI003EBBAF75
MSKKTKLELTWIGKDEEPRLEPRILLEYTEKSHHADVRNSENDLFDNRLIFGDNLLALKSLQQEFAGKVKCIFIDPPYNTGSAFEHYDDGIEHSLWLTMLRDRLQIIKSLLRTDGSLWITIDDNESHYLKVLCDEIFGRSNFVANIVWQKRTSPDMRATLGAGHDHILVYARNLSEFKKILKLLPKTGKQKDAYKNPDNDSRGPWMSTDFTAQGYRPNQMYTIVTPGGAEYTPPAGRCWKNVESVYLHYLNEGRLWFGKNGVSVPRQKTYLSESQGQAAWTWWTNAEVGHNQEAKKEINELFGAENAFDTPKPERLIQRIVHLSTDPGDIVLDSFAGSGTTGVVAHKMGRRWIMIELGEHCHTHIIPRMKRVIDGTDQGGITKEVNWQGGGGFRYYRLAPSLLEKDKFGNWIINKEYNAPMLAEAMCKHHGFTYEPDEAVYWKQGWSTETDYIYTTTQLMTRELATQIHDSLGEGETLLICCKAFNLNEVDFPNITFQKIPASILNRCEFGRDDYSLNVAQLPQPEKLEQLELFSEGEGL